MNKIVARLFVVFAVVMMFGMSGCTREKVPAGYVGIKVNLYGGDKGVDTQEVGVGRYWLTMNEEMYKFPVFTQNYVWTKNRDEGSPNDESISFQTKEGMSVNTDVGIAYHIDPRFVAKIFQKYHKGVDEITGIYLRNAVRDAFVLSGSTKSVESVYGEKKTALMKEVTDNVKANVPQGIIIEKIYLVGDMRLPGPVITALNGKIQATQKAQQRENQIREAEASAKIKEADAHGDAQSILIKAKAEADANLTIARSLTPELVRYKMIEKWDGAVAKVSGGNTAALFDMSNALTGK